MKAAIIDVGSNSIRLLLGTYIDGQWLTNQSGYGQRD